MLSFSIYINMFLRKFKFYFNIRSYSFKRNVFPQKNQINRNLIGNAIETNKINSLQDWKHVREALLNDKSNKGQYTNNNIDTVILGYCIRKKKYNLGFNYVDFLKEENVKPNLAFIGKYLKLIYQMHEQECFKEGKKCQQDQEQLILKTYNDLRKEFPFLDSFSLENIISALSITTEWKQCLDLLKEIKISAIPSGSVYSSVAAAAFLNKEEELAWQLITEMIENEKPVNSVVFLAYLNSLKRLRKQEKLRIKLEEMLLFLQENDFILDSQVPEKILEFGKKICHTASLTSVTQNGVCQNCRQRLKRFDLSDEEFEDLKNRIFEKVILGKDVFVKTNPEELEKFKKFISNTNHFDVVLDGLNIAYSAGTKQPPRVLAALLKAVVSHFAEQNKEVLVVGRHHMTKWPRESWNYITEHSTVFLAQNISQDDPYLLYCALHSGKDTIIVTRDLMRSHKFLLKTPKHRLMFNRWLSQRQYQLVKVTGTGKPVLRYPPVFTQTTQKIENYWHLPFKREISDDEVSIDWLCFSFQD